MPALTLFSSIFCLFAALFSILCIRDTNSRLLFLMNTAFLLLNTLIAAINLDSYFRTF